MPLETPYTAALRRPRLVVGAALALTMLAATGIARLSLRTDGRALVPSGGDAAVHDGWIRETFGLGDPVVLALRTEHPDGIYNHATLSLLVSLTDALAAHPSIGPGRVTSLATEISDHHVPGTLRFRPFLDPLPESPAALETLRGDVEAFGIYAGTLVATGGGAAAILVGAPNVRDRSGFVRDVESIARAAAMGHPDIVEILGAPVAESRLGTHILSDLRLLVPVALALMALVFYVSFRSLAGVVLPLLEVGMCLAFVFGVMGHAGAPVYLTIAVMPVILTAIGVADEIHVFAGLLARRRARPETSIHQAIADTMGELRRPIVLTSVSTAVGFLSFGLSPLAPVRAFGVFTALGILYCMLFSLVVLPALLVLSNGAIAGGRGPLGGLAGAFRALAATLGRRRWPVLGVFALLAALVPVGATRLSVQDSWIDGFSRDSDLRSATERFNREFAGSHVLLVTLTVRQDAIADTLPESRVGEFRLYLEPALVGDARTLVGRRVHVVRTSPHPPDDEPAADPRLERFRRATDWDSWVVEADTLDGEIVALLPRRDGSPRFTLRLRPGEEVGLEIPPRSLEWPAVVDAIGRLERFIAGAESLEVGGVLGPATYVATTQYVATARRAVERRVPPDPDRIAWIYDQYGRLRGENRRREFVADDRRAGVISVYLERANYRDTALLLEKIESYAAEHLAPLDVEIGFGGDVALSQAMIGGVVTTQVRSLLFSLVGILLVSALLHRSLAWGALSVLPCALAVGGVFAAMGFLGVPLGVSTSMFCGMTLGIGVDFAIHLIARFRRARARGLSPRAALADATGSAGPGITVDAAAVAIGFGVLVFSDVPANARLGLIAMIAVGVSWSATLLLLPALLARSETSP